MVWRLDGDGDGFVSLQEWIAWVFSPPDTRTTTDESTAGDIDTDEATIEVKAETEKETARETEQEIRKQIDEAARPKQPLIESVKKKASTPDFIDPAAIYPSVIPERVFFSTVSSTFMYQLAN